MLRFLYATPLCFPATWQWTLTLSSPLTKVLSQIQNFIKLSKLLLSYLVRISSSSKCFFITQLKHLISLTILIINFWTESWPKNDLKGYYHHLEVYILMFMFSSNTESLDKPVPSMWCFCIFIIVAL